MEVVMKKNILFLFPFLLLQVSIFSAERMFTLSDKDSGKTVQVSALFIEASSLYSNMLKDLNQDDDGQPLPLIKSELFNDEIIANIEQIIRMQNRDDLKQYVLDQQNPETLLKIISLIDALEMINKAIIDSNQSVEFSDLVIDFCAQNIYNSSSRSAASVASFEKEFNLPTTVKVKLFDALFKRIAYEGNVINAPLNRNVTVVEPYDSEAFMVGTSDGYISVINAQGVNVYNSASTFGTRVLDIVTSPNGLFAASRASNSSRVGLLTTRPLFNQVMIDLQDEEEQDCLPTALAFSDDGNKLFVGDDQGFIHVVNTTSNHIVENLRACEFSVEKIHAKGQKLFCACRNRYENEAGQAVVKHVVKVADFSQEDRAFKIVVEQDATTSSFLVAQQGRSVLVEDNYGGIKSFDTQVTGQKNKINTTFSVGGSLMLSSLVKDRAGMNEYFIMGSKIGSPFKAFLYEVTKSERQAVYETTSNTPNKFVKSSKISPDAQLVALNVSDNSVELFDRSTFSQLTIFPQEEDIVQYKFFSDGSLVTLSDQGQVVVWESGKSYIKNMTNTDDSTIYQLPLSALMKSIFLTKLKAVNSTIF